ncbi:MAG: CoA pyrophosphatase [Deltaproteobacteria bacterium]|nr:CoA pyrophosphatase [Deltaproteobacteria bacterium]
MIETIQQFCPAAVLIPFFEKNGELHLIVTKRTKTVQHHKGQICFPGGGQDQDDKTLWHTALRETCEEIGIPASQVYFIRELPKIKTPSMFEVTPFIGFIFSGLKLKPNPKEIEAILTVPFDHLRDKKNMRVEEREYLGKKHEVPFFDYQGTDIWGITGRIIVNVLGLW